MRNARACGTRKRLFSTGRSGAALLSQRRDACDDRKLQAKAGFAVITHRFEADGGNLAQSSI
jgi:hypothetical protein